MSRLFALLCAAACLSSAASARMGETLAECKARYGEPRYRDPGLDENTFEWRVGGRPGVTDEPFRPFYYITINFVDGKAAQIGLIFYLSQTDEKYPKDVKWSWPVPELLAEWAHPGRWTYKPNEVSGRGGRWYSEDGRYVALDGTAFYAATGHMPATGTRGMTISSADKFKQDEKEESAAQHASSQAIWKAETDTQAKWWGETAAREQHLSGLRRTTEVKSALMGKNKANVKLYLGRAPDDLRNDDSWSYNMRFFDPDSEKVLTSVNIGFFEGKVWHVTFYNH